MPYCLRLLRALFRYYDEGRIPRAAAALAYYLTMTFFPLLICLYALLGRSYPRVLQALDFVSQFISARTAEMLRGFMRHVALHQSSGIFFAGLAVLISTASAAVRSLQGTIGEMQGKRRFQGLADLLFSVLFSLAFVAAIYFGILVLFTGRDFLERVGGCLSLVDVDGSWPWVRFLLLAGLSFVLFWTVYAVSRQESEAYPCVAGAAFSMLGLVGMSLLFSDFIAASARYPLLYGSLTSLILLMLWLYLSCQIICLGAALNLALRDLKAGR